MCGRRGSYVPCTYQMSPGEDPFGYVFAGGTGALLTPLTGGRALKPRVLSWDAHVVPSAFERLSKNYPKWRWNLAAAFMKSFLASAGQTIGQNILGGFSGLSAPPASARVKGPGSLAWAQ